MRTELEDLFSFLPCLLRSSLDPLEALGVKGCFVVFCSLAHVTRVRKTGNRVRVVEQQVRNRKNVVKVRSGQFRSFFTVISFVATGVPRLKFLLAGSYYISP